MYAMYDPLILHLILCFNLKIIKQNNKAPFNHNLCTSLMGMKTNLLGILVYNVAYFTGNCHESSIFTSENHIVYF